MSRYILNRQVLAKIETTPGTLVTTAAADAILLKNVTINFPDEGDPRQVMRGYLGNSEILPGLRPMTLTFTTELASSGTLGTAPAWGILMRACGFAEVVTASTRVEYNPISTAFESLSFGFVNDGVKYTGRFGRGTVKINWPVNKAPTMDWVFTAIDATGSALANPAPTFSTWKTPQTVTDYNTSSLKTGASYSAGVVTAGTAIAWSQFMVDVNTSVDHVALVGTAEAVDISDRDIKGSVTAFLDTTNEVQWMTDWRTPTLGAFTLQHGSSSGNKIILHAGNVQKTNVQPTAINNRAAISADLQIIPTAGGSNDMILVAI